MDMKEFRPEKDLIHNSLGGLEAGRIDPVTAFAMLEFVALGGNDPEAWYHLARFHHDGTGCEKDDTEAMECLRKAAEGGWADAQYMLALRCFKGDLVAEDHVEGAKWLRKAAEQGHRDAANRLTDCYMNGDGVQKDVDEALRWLDVVAAGATEKDIMAAEEEDAIPLEECLPEEGSPLWRELSGNGLLTAEGLAPYREFREGNRGGSMENPLVISETDDYVHLEYELLDFLLQGPARFVTYRLLRQSLYQKDGRSYDALKVEVTDIDKHFDEEGCTREETWWFDITAGFEAMRKELHGGKEG